MEKKNKEEEKVENTTSIYDTAVVHLEEGQIVKGTIVGITAKEVVVDIGYKSEGIIPVHEFRSPEELKVGNEIDVLLEKKEDDNGMIELSRQKVNRAMGWENISRNCNEGDIIEGKVLKRVKGGFMVDVGIEAFLPGSQAALKESAGGPDSILGQTSEFMILKINKPRKNIIISRRSALSRKREEDKKKVFEALTKGSLVKGVVKNITDFGAFVDIGGSVIGLLHIADMSWGRVNHPSEIVAIGDEIEVMVLDFNMGDMRVSLGLRQKTQDPWENVEKKYTSGNKITGKVVSLLPYGAFVELEKGVEGLVHISEFSWTKKYASPGELLAIGEKVEVMILDVDRQARKISLGIKQLEQDPWMGVEDRYTVGQQVTGKVRNVTDYGAFVELEEGIDGLVHVSDLSWTKKIAHPKDLLKRGDTISAMVLSVDGINRRIALGVKQLAEDPWDKIQERYSPGTMLRGKIVKITNFGMFVELEKDLEGLLHISETALGAGEKLETKFKIEDEIEVKVLRVDGVQKKIALSVKDM